MGMLKYLLSKNKFELGRTLRKKAYKHNEEVEDIVKEVKENGFAVVANFYTEEECAILRKDIDSLIEQRIEENRILIDSQEADKRCYLADEDNEIINKYFNNSFLSSVADNYFKAKMLCSNTLAARIDYKKDNIGSGSGWHRDGNHMQFKAIVYLSDVEMKDGPFQILQGSHQSKNILKHIKLIDHDGINLRFTNEQVAKIIENEPSDYKVLTAKAGTLVFADTSTIHTGMPLSEGGQRYTLFNYYYPSYEDIDARRKTFKYIHTQSSEYEEV